MKNVTELLKEASDSGAVIIAATEPMKCSECGDVSEIRPYGKNGAWVCFPCGMKDEETAKQQFAAQFGKPRHKHGTA